MKSFYWLQVLKTHHNVWSIDIPQIHMITNPCWQSRPPVANIPISQYKCFRTCLEVAGWHQPRRTHLFPNFIGTPEEATNCKKRWNLWLSPCTAHSCNTSSSYRCFFFFAFAFAMFILWYWYTVLVTGG